ncbi:MAG: hypothetical protein ABSH51_28110 [Solirubrobacteraceae bacterium]|jgi:hypothetical protein
MFQSSFRRLQALIALADDLLGDPEPAAPAPHPHPHRRTVRIDRPRRAGAVPPRPTHCISPVARARPDQPRRDRVS